MRQRWLCSGGNDEHEKQSTNVGWAGEGVMPYVQSIKLLGSRTQHSTEEAGEQRGNIDLSGVRGGKDVTERNSGTGGRSPYTVTVCCVVSTWSECAGEHKLIMQCVILRQTRGRSRI